MPDGGRLDIETTSVNLIAPDSPAWESFVPGDYVRLRISDTGFGMDQQTAEQIFEPFFTTKPSDKGTGLGLSTVHGIVVQHGGSISVRSKPGEGTCFQILLPTVVEDALDIGEEEDEAIATGSACLLVVEDDDRMRELLDRALVRRGYQALVCENGEKALAILAQRDAPVDLLLTDVVMPGINGRDLYSRALQTNPDLKVLYMSGHTRDILSHRGIEEGTVQLIEKPFSIRNLTVKIEEVLGRPR
jgi:CheY-like chemotaxis protein